MLEGAYAQGAGVKEQVKADTRQGVQRAKAEAETVIEKGPENRPKRGLVPLLRFTGVCPASGRAHPKQALKEIGDKSSTEPKNIKLPYPAPPPPPNLPRFVARQPLFGSLH